MLTCPTRLSATIEPMAVSRMFCNRAEEQASDLQLIPLGALVSTTFVM